MERSEFLKIVDIVSAKAEGEHARLRAYASAIQASRDANFESVLTAMRSFTDETLPDTSAATRARLGSLFPAFANDDAELLSSAFRTRRWFGWQLPQATLADNLQQIQMAFWRWLHYQLDEPTCSIPALDALHANAQALRAEREELLSKAEYAYGVAGKIADVRKTLDRLWGLYHVGNQRVEPSSELIELLRTAVAVVTDGVDEAGAPQIDPRLLVLAAICFGEYAYVPTEVPAAAAA